MQERGSSKCHAIHTEFVENWKICVPVIHNIYGFWERGRGGGEGNERTM